MGGGGKTTQSTQGVTIPPEVLARYNSVNATAQAAAQTPFQQYGGQFVAPTNATQNAGIAQSGSAATEAQPYYGAATNSINSAQAGTAPVNGAAEGLAAASAQAVNPGALGADQISQYMNPYLGTVLGSTAGLINQQNQQAASGEAGNAIESGAFGGDRAGIAQANLQQQQILGEGNVFSGIASNAYDSALGAAQQQQGVQLGAAQANRSALGAAGQELAGIGQTAYGEGANTATTLANLGAGAQSAAESGAQSEIAAGTVAQQTAQAVDAANYNQFLQQKSYPFQTAQFLANVAEGTGALSGSTTTTTQPGGFFSDERLKEDVKPIGKMFDGQTIVRFRYKGEPHTRIGLIAQDVEKHHPEAVGLHPSGYKVVEHGRATDAAARRGHFQTGGLAISRGGIVDITDRYRGYASGGSPVLPGLSGSDMAAILAAQQAMYAGYGLGSPASAHDGPYGGAGRVPPPTGATPHLVTAQGGVSPGPTGAQNTNSGLGLAGKVGETGKSGYGAYQKYSQEKTQQTNDYIDKLSAQINQNNPVQAPDEQATSDQVAQDMQAQEAASQPAPASAADTADATTADAATNAGTDAAANAGADAAADAGADAAADAGAEAATEAGAEMAAEDAVSLFKRGGSIRKGLAAGGGTPYSQDPSDTTLSIPDENADNKLITAAKLPAQPKSGFQQIASMGNPSTMIDAMQRGGLARAHRDDGGSNFDQSPDTKLTVAGPEGQMSSPSGLTNGEGNAIRAAAEVVEMCMNAGGRVGRDAGGRIGLAGGGDPSADWTDAPPDDGGLSGAIGRAGGALRDKLGDVWHGITGLGRDRSAEWTDPTPARRAAPPPAAPAHQPTPLVAPTTPGSFLTATDQTPPAPEPGLAPPGASPAPTPEPSPVPAPVTNTTAPAASGAPPGGPDAPAAPSGGLSGAVKGAGSSLKEKLGDIWHGLKSADADTLQGAVPLLTGLAAMGTAPTRHLGVALAAGLGAGTDSYMQTRQGLAKTAQTQAQTDLIQTEADVQQQHAAAIAAGTAASAAFSKSPSGVSYVLMPDGNKMTEKDWISAGKPATFGSAQAKAAMQKNSAVAVPYNKLGAPQPAAPPSGDPTVWEPTLSPSSKQYLAQDAQSVMGSGHMGTDTASRSEDQAKISQAADSARATGTQLANLARLTSAVGENDFQKNGPLVDLKQTALTYLNDIATTAGLPPLSGQAEADNISEQRKLSAILSFAQTSNAGQHNQTALEAAQYATPNPHLSRHASLDMISSMMVEKQRDIDFARFENKAYNESGFQPAYRTVAARNAFRSQYSDEYYQAEKQRLRQMLDDPKAIEMLMTGTHPDGSPVSGNEKAAFAKYHPETRYIYNR